MHKSMALFLSFLIFSFVVTSVCIVPFINLLYKFKMTRKKQKTKDFQDKPTPIFDRYHKHKVGTPVGGGFLMVLIISLLFAPCFQTVMYWAVSVCASFYFFVFCFFLFFHFNLLFFFHQNPLQQGFV
jgi:UDP-N-acetylmuramyl pentapeptide phosphotransferase/UDP-N-acetylglucosamine-1-phosphate transferase